MIFARRRTTGIRPVLPRAPVRIAACAVAAAVTAPCPVQPAAQDTAAARAIPLRPGWPPILPEPAFICGSPALEARQMIRGAGLNPISLSADPESPEGQPLWFDQQPRLIRADSEGPRLQGLPDHGRHRDAGFSALVRRRGRVDYRDVGARHDEDARRTAGQCLQSDLGRSRAVGRHRTATPRIRQSRRVLRHGQGPEGRPPGRQARRRSGRGRGHRRNCTSDCRSSRSTSPRRESGRSTQTSSTPATS